MDLLAAQILAAISTPYTRGVYFASSYFRGAQAVAAKDRWFYQRTSRPQSVYGFFSPCNES